MPHFTFNSELNAGHLLTVLAVLVAAFALYVQARSLKVSERQMQIKVSDLSDLVGKLEDEAKERQSLQKKQTAYYVEQLNDYAKALNHTTNLYRHVSFVNYQNEQLVLDRLRVTSASFGAIARIIKAEANTPEGHLLRAIADVHAQLLQLLTIEREEGIARNERLRSWNEAFQALLEEYSRHPSDAQQKKIDEKQQELIRITTEMNTLLGLALESTQASYRAARDQLFAQLQGEIPA